MLFRSIDMAKLEEFIAFRAVLTLHQEDGNKESIVQKIYQKCIKSIEEGIESPPNHVKELYDSFTNEQISEKIAKILKEDNINAEVEVIFQNIGGLHKACPNNLGDWYFSGDYPTPGGCRVVNKAFINFVEKNNRRAY